jgi:hypothetical protein
VNIFLVIRESFHSHFCQKKPSTKKNFFHEQHEIMSSPLRQGVRKGLPSYSTKSGQCLLSHLGGGKSTKSHSLMPRSQLGGGGSSLAAAAVAVVAQRSGSGGRLAAAAWRQRQHGSRVVAAWWQLPAARQWR